jgi:hypothetical protein
MYKLIKQRNGGGLQCYVETSFGTLVTLFGMPNSNGDGYKASTEWALEDDLGNELAIYDYKDTNLYQRDNMTVAELRGLPNYNWHIGGENKVAAETLRDYIYKASQVVAPTRVVEIENDPVAIPSLLDVNENVFIDSPPDPILDPEPEPEPEPFSGFGGGDTGGAGAGGDW